MRRSQICIDSYVKHGSVAHSVRGAQENATIVGTVMDSTNAVVPNAEITLTNTATSQERKATSNSSGIYLFANVGVGHFTLNATAKGFQKYVKTDIVVNTDQTLKEDVNLTVGSEAQTVTVEADALQLQSETNEVSNLISGAQITQLATNGRNVVSLAALGMGVSNNLPAFGGVNALTSANGISFNGTRVNHNIYLLDGGELNDRGCGGCFSSLPSVDALAEFQTLDSNYGPDYGIGSGGTILMVLKSGTSSFHGGLWEFNRNADYNANNYFSNLAGQQRSKFDLNVFGGNIGGPLWIPHVYNESRKRTFFFVNEEWRKLIQGSAPAVKNTIACKQFPSGRTRSGIHCSIQRSGSNCPSHHRPSQAGNLWPTRLDSGTTVPRQHHPETADRPECGSRTERGHLPTSELRHESIHFVHPATNRCP